MNTRRELAAMDLQELIAQFEIVTANKPRPAHVPAGWLVFNAPRPLYGTLIATGGSEVWQDTSGLIGWHFAAINLADPMARVWLECNLRNKAVLIQYSD